MNYVGTELIRYPELVTFCYLLQRECIVVLVYYVVDAISEHELQDCVSLTQVNISCD